MTRAVYLLGGAQTNFADNWARTGRDITDMMAAVVTSALADADMDPHQIDSAHVGNFAAELFCGQGQLGGVLAEVHPAFRELPISRHEAACASGSMAAMAAMTEIEAGRAEISAVLGLEIMRNVEGDLAAEHLGAAAWVDKEASTARFIWPWMFSSLMDEYKRRYGLHYNHLGAIAEKNLTNAKRNPNAQTLQWGLRPEYFVENDTYNPIVEGGVRKYDCGRVTDGAAMVFLASPDAASAYASSRGLTLGQIPRIKGWGHRTARMGFSGKMADARSNTHVFPHVRRTIEDCFSRAGLNLAHIDAIETHDCFAITEYMAIDHFGITPPGESWMAVENGDVAMDGHIPINPSGGLIGLGHPVGATGVRMLLDAWKQVTGKAGDYQVEGARNVATLNIGGSTTTTACFVVGIS